jgi:membrane protease YdiL (CAAX protease family)
VQIPGIDPSAGLHRRVNVPWSIRDVLLGIGVVIGLVLVTILLLEMIANVTGQDDDWTTSGDLLGFPMAMALAILLETFFLGPVIYFAVLRRGAILRQIGFVKPQGRRPYLVAIAAWLVGVAALIVWSLLTEALGIDLFKIPEPPAELVDFSGIKLALPLIVIGLFGPFCEEVFFRGFALPAFASRFGMWGGILISAALFSVFHLSIGAAVPIFVFGIVLAWLYVRTGSIYPSMVAHITQNIIATLAANWPPEPCFNVRF